MATKKMKTISDANRSGRLFHDEWTTEYEAIKHDDRALCCIFKKVIISHNYNRHFRATLRPKKQSVKLFREK